MSGMAEPQRDDEGSGSGAGPIIGVVFVIALTIGAVFMIQKMRDAATLADCAFTHAPACRALLQDKK